MSCRSVRHLFSVAAGLALCGLNTVQNAPAQVLYVSNYGDNTIHKFSSTGADLGVFATGVNGPTGMAFDGSGNLYVTSFNASTVLELSPTGTLLQTLTSPGLNSPDGLVIDGSGRILVSNRSLDTIEAFSSTGTDLGVLPQQVRIPVIWSAIAAEIFTPPTSPTIRYQRSRQQGRAWAFSLPPGWHLPQVWQLTTVATSWQRIQG